MATIAFFKFSDFVREVRGTAPAGAPPVVRLEALTKTVNGDPSPLVRFELWLTAQPNGDVLVARFLTGSCLKIFLSHEPHHELNQKLAERILRERLAAQGFDVRPGVIEHETTLQAHGEGLWHYDRETKELKTLEVE